MKIKYDTIKIEMSLDEAYQLRAEFQKMIEDIKSLDEALRGYFDESELRERHPKINEMLNMLNVNNNTLPF